MAGKALDGNISATEVIGVTVIGVEEEELVAMDLEGVVIMAHPLVVLNNR